MAFKVRSDSNSLLENSGATGNVLSNDSSATQVTLIRFGTGTDVPVTTGGVTLQGTYGILTILPDGSYTYTASTTQADQLKAGATASDSFSYTATDGGTKSGSTTLKFTVTGVNDAPVLSSTTATLTTITEDQTTNSGQTVSSFLQSTDVDSSALKGLAITSLGSGNGQWQYSTNGGTSWSNVGSVSETSALLLRSTDKIRFVPNGNDGTTANFTYHAWDQTSGTYGTKVDASANGGQTAFSAATGTASINVTAINDAPVAVASTASGVENGPPVTGQLTATDVDSTTLTYSVVANSTVGGSVSIDPATGNYTFTPTQDFNGTASFRFTANDGSLTSAAATVTITITGVNSAPVLSSTTATLTTITEDQTTNAGQTVASFLQSTDADTNALSGVAITGLDPGNGQWQYSTNGGTSWSAVGTVSDASALLLRSTDKIRFVPNAIDGTTANFSYHAWDQTSGTTGTKVDTTINGGQTAFSTATGTASITVTPVNDAPVAAASTASGTEDVGPITGQVTATDVDSTTLTYAAVANSAVGGSVSVDSATGNYSFTPAQDFNGTASFRFTANDGSVNSAPATVTIAIAPVNDPPVAVADSGSTSQGVAVLLDVLANDTDVDGDTLSIAGVGNASNGTVAIQSGKVLYTPNSGYTGSDAFTYTASDGHGGTAIGNVSVNVTTTPNQPPVANADSATTTQNTATVIDVLANDSDPDGGTLSLAGVGNATNGTVAIQSGKVLYTPNNGYAGSDAFTYTLSDGQGGTAVGNVSVTVNTANQPPVATADSATTTQNNATLIDVLANDRDPDGGTLSIAGLTNATNGTVAIQSGKVLYTPNNGYTGSDAFTYTVSDGQGGTAVGNVSVSVGSPPPPPGNAATVTFRQGTNGYTGTVDTMLRERYPNDNYGNAFVVSPQGDTGKHTQGLLAFNNLFGTGPGQIPVGATIVSATLTLMTTQPTIDGGTINPMLSSWTASSTWNSMVGGVTIGTEASSANAVAIGAATVGTHSYDVSASVQAWASAGTTAAAENAANHGWLFNLPSGTDFWNFTSSEGDVKPVLSITYVPAGTSAPSPTTLPTVSISGPPANTAVSENSGKITFTVTLSQAATQDVTVNYATADGTAKASSDYTATTGTLTFHAGETSKTFDVQLTNDAVAERTEGFTVQLTSATNAIVATASMDAHIKDDDANVAPFAPLSASVLHVWNVSDPTLYPDDSNGLYGIGDPSGIAWIPSLNQFFVADSEHDETPYNSLINMWALRPDGTDVRNYSLEGFTKEPTGLGYDPNNGFLYISDDSKAGVFWVDPANPTVKLGFFDTKLLGYQDTEDLKIDPLTGHIFEVDGELMQLIELTTTGQFVDSRPLPSIMKDAEALAYDPRHDVFFVSSGHETSHNIYVVDPLGNVLDTITALSSYSGTKVKGLELAPSSDPNDGNQLSLYVCDYGADQVNDGRIFEIHLPPDWIF